MIYWPKYADGEPMKLAEMPPPLRAAVVDEVLYARVRDPMLRMIIQLLLATRGFYSMPPAGRVIEHDCS